MAIRAWPFYTPSKDMIKIIDSWVVSRAASSIHSARLGMWQHHLLASQVCVRWNFWACLALCTLEARNPMAAWVASAGLEVENRRPNKQGISTTAFKQQRVSWWTGAIFRLGGVAHSSRRARRVLGAFDALLLHLDPWVCLKNQRPQHPPVGRSFLEQKDILVYGRLGVLPLNRENLQTVDFSWGNMGKPTSCWCFFDNQTDLIVLIIHILQVSIPQTHQWSMIVHDYPIYSIVFIGFPADFHGEFHDRFHWISRRIHGNLHRYPLVN